MSSADYLPIYKFTRGETIESLHFGAAAIVNTDGQLIAWHGNPEAVTFLRSTAKPFQAIPLIESGGLRAFALDPAEIALICSSHAGTDIHVEVARRLQAKIGIHESDLLCGSHPVSDQATAAAMRLRGEKPTPIRHNCSGKHSGMLAYAMLKGWSGENYIDPTHPIQVDILHAFAQMTDMESKYIAVGIDGCSVPNFAIPLYNTALGYARLCDPQGLDSQRAKAVQTITTAMTTHPEMVGGPDHFDTRLMEVGQGRILAKGGAEGYLGIGLSPGVMGPDTPGLGIAIKISDGDKVNRVQPGVAIEILHQLGVLGEADRESLSPYGPSRPVRNWRNLEVGTARPCFALQTR